MAACAISNTTSSGWSARALIEREMLLRAMPHIIWPLRFVLPYQPISVRERDADVQALATVMPWMKGCGPPGCSGSACSSTTISAGGSSCPAPRTLDLQGHARGRGARAAVREGVRVFRLLGRGFAARRAERARRRRARRAHHDAHQVLSARADGRALADRNERYRKRAGAGAPARACWSTRPALGRRGHPQRLRINAPERVRLVQGSHIVVRKLFDHDRATSSRTPTAGSSSRSPTRTTSR